MPMTSPWPGPSKGAGLWSELPDMKPTSRYSSIPPAERLPEWLRRPIGNASDLEAVQGVVKQQRLHTICEEGRCLWQPSPKRRQ